MKIKELCLAGAANRGIAYVGVIKCLEDNDALELEKFVGVSIGALVGIAYIIGYSMDDLFSQILDQDISEFQDISIEYILHQGSVLKGDKYKQWVWSLMSTQIDPMTTLEDLCEKYNIDIIMSALSLDSGKDGLEYFSKTTTPKIPIYYAVMASMAIPFVFPPIVYNGKRYIDAFVVENFPMDKLSKEGVGFKVTSKSVDADITNFTYITKIMQLITSHMDKIIKYEGTCVTIDGSDFTSLDFNLTIDNKITLYYRGYNTTQEFLNTKTKKTPTPHPTTTKEIRIPYNDPQELPILD